MSTPRRPSRLAVYSSTGSFYPRELVELDGILYIIKNGKAVSLNQISQEIKDSAGNSIGTLDGSTAITFPASTNDKYGLVKLSNAAAQSAGTGAPGTSFDVSRADHVHPLQTTVSGNAGSASKLQTARKISITGGATGSADFDGSKAIEIDVELSVGAAAKSNSYTDLDNLPDIPSASDTNPSAAGAAAPGTLATFARADHVHPLQTTVSGNAGSASKLQTARTISLSGGASGSASFDGSKNIDINVTKIDASKISGTLSIDNIPQGALERLIPVKDDAARKALTTTDVQNGDVVKVQSTGLMYYVVDDTKLGTTSVESAFESFTAGSASAVPWSGITDKPTFGAVATSNDYNDLDNLPTIPTIPNLSKGTTSGSGNVVTDVTVSGHQITLTKGITALTAHPSITMGTNGTDTASSPTHGGSFTVVSSISKDSNGHVTKYNTKTVNIPDETSLSKDSDGSTGNVISDIAVSGHKITLSKITALTSHQNIPSLSKGTTTGSGNVVTDVTVSGHQITLAKGITALTEHPAITTTATPADPTTASSLAHGSTFVIPTTLTRDDNGHLTSITKTKYKLPSETSLSMGTQAGSGNVVTGISVSGHQITVTKGITALTAHQSIPNVEVSVPTAGNFLSGVSIDSTNKHKLVFTKGTALTSETSLSKGTTSGSGNVVTDITVSGHKITLTKDITALTAHPAISQSTNSTSTSSPVFGETFTAIDSITKDSNGHVTKINTKTVTIPSQTALSKSTSGSGDLVGDLSVSGHAITVTKKNPSTTYTAAVGTTWTGDAAPYTQTINVSGIAASDNPIVDVVLSDDYDTATTELEEYAKIYKITTDANSITVYATEATENAINIQLKVVK